MYNRWGSVFDWLRLLLLAAAVSACATAVPSDRYVFKALETVDSSKRFTYGYATRPNLGGSQNIGEGASSRNSGRDPRSLVEPGNFEEMRKELKIYMTATGYCTKGYFVYDETFNGAQYLLHGECQESNNNE